MRKSAAPSVLKQKKSQFIVPYARNVNASNAPNVCNDNTPASATYNVPSARKNSNNDQDERSETSNVREADYVNASSFMKYLNEERYPVRCLKPLLNINIKEPNFQESPENTLPSVDVPIHEKLLAENKELTLDDTPSRNSTDATRCLSENPHHYNVLWCKRSMKKHKKWEGDAVLSINGLSATLKDTDGIVIAKGIGYKIKEVTGLREGSSFFIGGKECEIQSVISKNDIIKEKRCSESKQKPIPVCPSFGKKFCSPLTTQLPKKIKLIPSAKVPRNPDAVYMPQPSFMQEWDSQQLEITDVKIDSFLSMHLRPHQKEGVIFMYECIMGFKDSSYRGVILGDEMGLGKTLQCITLVWTLFKQGPYGGKPILRKVLIITPSSLVKNWQTEFYKWLGRDRIPVFAVSQNKKVKDFVHSKYAVLLISYEMYVRSVDILSAVKFDLVICDEGHRLKNINIKTSSVITNLPTLKRILLTGTPIQNDLGEFYSIVEFVNPGILGSLSSFRRVYEDPITRRRHPDCNEDERILGDDRAAELASVIGSFMLRRTQEVINKFLPPKLEVVVFVQPSDLQCLLYEHLLQSRDVRSFLTMEGLSASHSPLAYILGLRKLCNHPSLLKAAEPENNVSNYDDSIQEHVESVFPKDYVYSSHHSGKMNVLEKLLKSLFHLTSREKIVVVSNFVRTLDLIEDLCKRKDYQYLRLDGSTNSSLRLDLVEQFNSPLSKHRVFLLSSKAGGVGLNLIGASRILLYDIDWNPATDLQAMARVWRDGQKKLVYVYRLLTVGTIEEKMFQRQISKQELYGTVTDTTSSRKAQFSREELKDLFTFHQDVQCQTHDIMKCTCLLTSNQTEESYDKDDVQNPYTFGFGKKKATPTKNTTMDELRKWKHVPGPVSEADLPNSCLETCGDNVSFLFVNAVNFHSKNEFSKTEAAYGIEKK